MSETQVVEIVLLDDANYEKTLRIDNPKSSLTLSTIRAAFQSAISEGWLLGKSGAAVTSIPRATITQTIKTPVA